MQSQSSHIPHILNVRVSGASPNVRTHGMMTASRAWLQHAHTHCKQCVTELAGQNVCAWILSGKGSLHSWQINDVILKHEPF